MLADKVMDINYLLVKVFRTSNPNIAGRVNHIVLTKVLLGKC